MPALAHLAVRRRRLLLAIAILLLIPSLAGYLMTNVEYDITSYLPATLASKRGQDILERDFGLAANVFVMVEGQEPRQTADLRARLATVPGVERVSWLDSYVHPVVPLSFVPARLRDSYVSGEAALLLVQFVDPSGATTTQAAISTIRELVGPEAAVAGLPVILGDVNAIFHREIGIYTSVAVLAILVILSLASTSTFEPLVLLVAVGFSVIYNLGTNVMLGRISYITQAIAAVLQLAVSMDYGIFLIHRFAEEKSRHDSSDEAMIAAVTKTTTAIAASGLTTVAGFLALTVMQFGLGRDLGLVMAKGVLLSMVCTITLLPGLLLATERLTARYRHRSLCPDFTRVARWVVHHPWRRVALLIVLLIPAFLIQQRVEVFYAVEKGLSADVRSIADLNRVNERFGTLELVYLITDDQGLSREQLLARRVSGLPGVKSVQTLAEASGGAVPDFLAPREIRDQLRQNGYALTTIELNVSQGGQAADAVLQAIRREAAALYKTAYLTGGAALTSDLRAVTDRDIVRVNWLSVVAIATIIALAFTSLTIPVLLVLAIQFAIWVNLAGAALFGTNLYFITYLVLGAVQMGATVDYAILITSKFRELRHEHDATTAMELAVAGGGRSILTSSLTLTCATLTVGLLSNIRMAGQLCATLGVGAAISMLTAIFIVPSLLLVSEPLISRTTRDWPTGAARHQTPAVTSTSASGRE